MTSLCEYRDVFGRPGEGVHATRFLGLAAFDLVATVAGAAILALLTDVPFPIVLAVLLVVGIIAHRVFCVDTALNTMLFGNTVSK